MKVSIIVPVYNEERTVGKMLACLQKLGKQDFQYEIIVVDDGSSDNSKAIIQHSLSKMKDAELVEHRVNKGKGMAVRTGIKQAKGDYIVIQDADLEYNPKYIPVLVQVVLDNQEDVVYGTRLNRWPNLFQEEKTPRFMLHFIGNRFLSLLTSILYGQWLTDVETGYKVIPRKVLLDLKLETKGFEFEPEVTAKLLKRGCRIREVPIITVPRGYDEGKKLRTFRDGVLAFWTIVKYRFID